MPGFLGRIFSIFGGWIGLCCIVISACIVFAAFFLADNPPYVLIEADSQIVRFRVKRPQLVSIPLNNITMHKNLPRGCLGSSNDKEPITALLQINENAIVAYEANEEGVDIKVQGFTNNPGGILDFGNDKQCTLSSDPTYIPLFRIPKESLRQKQLPIAGPADIGIELNENNYTDVKKDKNIGFLSGGTVHVVGRSISPFAKDKLYPLGNAKFTIPRGSRISSGDPLNPGIYPFEVPFMYGLAEWGEKGLKISTSTVTDTLELYRPGKAKEVEELGLGLLTQILSDPGIVLFFMFLGCFSFLVQILNGLKNIAARPAQLNEKKAIRTNTKKHRTIRHVINAHRPPNTMRSS